MSHHFSGSWAQGLTKLVNLKGKWVLIVVFKSLLYLFHTRDFSLGLKKTHKFVMLSSLQCCYHRGRIMIQEDFT